MTIGPQAERLDGRDRRDVAADEGAGDDDHHRRAAREPKRCDLPHERGGEIRIGGRALGGKVADAWW